MTNKIKRNLFIWGPTVLWASVIFMFSSLPTAKTSDFYLQDFLIKKTAHVVEYGIFTILLIRSLTLNKMPTKKAIIISFLIAVSYAFTDEFHQSFTPGREPKLRDIGFDTIGSSLSIIAIWSIIPHLPKTPKKLANSLGLLLRAEK